MNTGPEQRTCRFLSSYGGVFRCQDPQYFLGFCAFHHGCYEKGEINANGRISDKLDDQKRRQEINFHSLSMPEDLRPSF